MTDLAKTIEFLESEHLVKKAEMQEEITIFYESLKPANILKNTLADVVASPGLLDVIAGTVSGVLSGYLTKKIFVGSSSNPIKHAAGSLLEVAITAFLVGQGDKIRALGSMLFRSMFPRDKQD
jgi:hypothetical protein